MVGCIEFVSERFHTPRNAAPFLVQHRHLENLSLSCWSRLAANLRKSLHTRVLKGFRTAIKLTDYMGLRAGTPQEIGDEIALLLPIKLGI